MNTNTLLRFRGTCCFPIIRDRHGVVELWVLGKDDCDLKYRKSSRFLILTWSKGVFMSNFVIGSESSGLVYVSEDDV